MGILQYIGTAVALAGAPLLLVFAVSTKIITFIPLLVRWSKDEEKSASKGVLVPRDEGKVAELAGKVFSNNY